MKDAIDFELREDAIEQADVDDSAARGDWGFAPRYDFDRAFEDYLIPTIRERYRR